MIQRFFKDVVIYALPMFLARAVGLLLLPIYTRQLGPADFGFIEFVAAASAILLLVLPLEINQAVCRLLPEAKSNHEKYKVIATALWFTCIAFISFGILIYLIRFQLLNILNLPSTYAQYAILICIHFLIQAIVNLLQIKFRFTSQAKSSVSINMSVVLSNLILVLYFSSTGQLGMQQYFLSQILSGLLGCVIGFVTLSKQYGTFPLFKESDISVLKILLKYSTPLVLSSIGISLTASVDRLAIGSNVGLYELGYYGAAVRLSAVVGLGFYVLSSAMTPVVYREYKKPETKVFIAKVFQLASYASLVLLGVITFYSKPIIILFVGGNFATASDYLFYVILGSVIGNFYIFFLGMDINKKTGLLSKINLSSGIASVIGCLIFVPYFGVWGAIFSMLIANTIRLVGYAYFSQKLYKISLKTLPLFISLILLTLINNLVIR